MKNNTLKHYGREINIVPGKLTDIWLAIPAYCNLACSYCYACGGEAVNVDNLLAWPEFERLLEQTALMGVKSVGIPGAGEPLLPRNRQLTMKILQKCKELGLYVTLFTTGEFITKQLAIELSDFPLEIMLKCNTLNPEKQDQFVSNPKRGKIVHGYGEKRNRALKFLMDAGFNDRELCQEKFGEKTTTRLSLVTSIMTDEKELSNFDDMIELLRFCRRNNIHLDCDDILTVGRGAGCELCTAEEKFRDKVTELCKIDREEFGLSWEVSSGYIAGMVCGRYAYHLFVDQYGDIRPCIGAEKVILGNIRFMSLSQAWESPAMQIIRARNYGGVCAQCLNFIEHKCNSCLGRRTKNLTTETLLAKGEVETIGCCNCRKA